MMRDAASFPFRFQAPFRLAGLSLGIRPDTTSVEVTDDELVIRFGPWRVRTAVSNVVSAQRTGPYRWPKVIGPPHLSFADRGLTLATNSHEGVCVHFGRPVVGLDPWGLIRHPAVTLTVEDGIALAELLELRADAARRHSGDCVESYPVSVGLEREDRVCGSGTVG